MNVELREVRAKVGSVRQAVVAQRLLVDVLRLLLLGLMMVAAMAAVDFFLVLGGTLRTVGLVAMLAALTLLAIRFARRRSHYAVTDAAADVEGEFPEYGQSIRTTLDYSDPTVRTAPAAAAMVRALAEDTRERAENRDFSVVVNRRPLLLASAALAAIVVVCLGSLVRAPELWISAGRTLLLPIHYTDLNVVPIEKPVPAGQDVTVVAEVAGRPVDQAKLYYRAAQSQNAWQELQLAPSDDDGTPPAVGITGKLSATIEDCEQDLEFHVVAGPRGTPLYQIRVLQPLKMEQFAAHVLPPIYTGLEPETVDKLDLQVIEGAEVDIELTLNRQAAEASLLAADALPGATDVPAATPIPLTIEGNVLKGHFDQLAASRYFLVAARAADGMQLETTRLRIRVRPDAKPKIRFVKPPEDLEVTPTTEVPLAIDARDDFGIRKVGIAARIADGPMQTLWEQEYTEQAPEEARPQPVLFLEEHPLTFQDAVTYYAYVEDNRPADQRRTTTELRFIDIRPYKREYQILEGGGT